MKTVVVGASSGLGRCIGTGLAQRGDEVALLARRKDRLDDAAKEAGEGAVVVECDVTDEVSIRNAVDEAASGLGGIDALIYCPGIGPLVKMVDTDADTWRKVFETNVIGASLMTAAALPHLAESRGAAMYLTSVSASQTDPWPGLGAYAVSKAALDKMIDAWRNEHPDIGFTRLVVGDCGGGEGDARVEFNQGWDNDLLVEVIDTWVQRAYISGTVMDVDHLVNMVHATLQHGAGISIPSLTVTPRYTGGLFTEADLDR